jgi:Leucine-rich repeat (LRR) protein
LTHLDLSHTRFSDIGELRELKNLRKLGLCNAGLTHVMHLATLPNLTFLVLSRNEKLSDVKPLAALKNLRFLDVSRTNVPAEDVQWLVSQVPGLVVYNGERNRENKRLMTD